MFALRHGHLVHYQKTLVEKVTENPVKVTTELILEQPAFRKCVLQVNQPQPTQLKENIAGSQELLNSNERSGLTKVKEKMRDQHVISVWFVSKRSRKKFDFFFFFFLLCFLFCDFFIAQGLRGAKPNKSRISFQMESKTALTNETETRTFTYMGQWYQTMRNNFNSPPPKINCFHS